MTLYYRGTSNCLPTCLSSQHRIVNPAHPHGDRGTYLHGRDAPVIELSICTQNL